MSSLWSKRTVTFSGSLERQAMVSWGPRVWSEKDRGAIWQPQDTRLQGWVCTRNRLQCFRVLTHNTAGWKCWFFFVSELDKGISKCLQWPEINWREIYSKLYIVVALQLIFYLRMGQSFLVNALESVREALQQLNSFRGCNNDNGLTEVERPKDANNDMSRVQFQRKRLLLHNNIQIISASSPLFPCWSI